MSQIASDRQREYLLKTGKPGRDILSIVAKLSPYYEAVMRTDAGKTLLGEAIDDHRKYLNIVYDQLITNGIVNSNDALMLKFSHDRLAKTNKILSSYEQCLEDINNKTAK